MRTSVFCTTAPIGMGHGGGASSYWELEALKATTDFKQVIQMRALDGRYRGDPFMWDYCTSLSVEWHAEVAIFNGAPWNVTKKVIDPQLTIVDCPAHNLPESIKEFRKTGKEYPFLHQTDPVLWPLYSTYLREANVIITQAKQSIGYLQDLGVTEPKFEVVPGGCILPDAVKPFPDQFKVGYIGASGPDKGISYLLIAWVALMYKDAVCVLAGRGGPNKESILKEMQGFRAKFEVMGSVEDLNPLYDSFSVYVQPSVTEGFGLTPLEAMSHGRPAIVTQGAGVHEIIEDGVDGFVVPIHDPQAIADRIRWLHDNPSRMETMGQAARKKAEQYTWQRAKGEYERIIQGQD